MAFYTSKRERRLWLWNLTVVVAIYSTLGLTRPLAGFLRGNGLLVPAFMLGMILIAAAILVQGLKRRPGGAEIAVVLGIAAVYIMVLVRIELAEERTHLIEYGVVSLLIHEALTERANQGRHVPLPALLAILITTLIGTIDECIQYFLPDRVFDPIDILFNFLAGTMAVLASLALAWARRRFGRNKKDQGLP